MAMNSELDREVTFKITEFIGVLQTHPTGWSKELNLVSWNGGTPKYDIRDWDPDHLHMSRGVTLHEKEMRQVVDLLRKRRTSRNGRARTEEVEVMEAIAEPANSSEMETDLSAEGPESMQEDGRI